jgi:SAM-dependent methyltransferase
METSGERRQDRRQVRNNPVQWFEDDNLWEGLYPFLFSPQRLAATPAEVEQLARLLVLPPGARVLDLGCGPGRHSLELARRGFTVTGVDRTSPYLDRARETARQQGLQLELVRSDMRDFRRPAAFDAAISMLTSFGYFEQPGDDLLVLRNLHESLSPGGALLIDVVGTEVAARIYRERDWQESADGALMLEERRVGDGWGEFHQRWILIRNGERTEFRFRHRMYSGQQLAALAVEAGFAGARLYGSLAATPYDHNAQRLILVARK